VIVLGLALKRIIESAGEAAATSGSASRRSTTASTVSSPRTRRSSRAVRLARDEIDGLSKGVLQGKNIASTSTTRRLRPSSTKRVSPSTTDYRVTEKSLEGRLKETTTSSICCPAAAPKKPSGSASS